MNLERISLRDSFNVDFLPFRKYKIQPYDVTGSQGTGSSRLEVTEKRNRKRNAYIFQDFHALYNRLRKSLKHYKDSPITAEHRTGFILNPDSNTLEPDRLQLARLYYDPKVFIGHSAFSPGMKLRRTLKKMLFQCVCIRKTAKSGITYFKLWVLTGGRT
jgi:hypothetical protein